MAGEKEKKEPEKKVTIHEKGGEFDDNLTIYEIEKALHPRAREAITDELTSILGKFVEENVDAAGNIMEPDKAADAFLELLARYHFGEAYESVESDKKHITDTLKSKYGVSREFLRKSFRRKGAFKKIDDFYAAHRDPLVARADEVRKTEAQESLNVYLQDENARAEIPEHLKTRLGKGKELSDSYETIMGLEDTINLIGNYMARDGAVEKIEKDKNAEIGLSDAQAGHPSIHGAFKEGDRFHEAYLEEAKIVDGTHRFKTKAEEAKLTAKYKDKKTGTDA